jgi:hypothetical protein
VSSDSYEEPVQQYAEPRWPAVIAILAVGGLYLALPDSLTFGPNWLFPSLVLALLIPTNISYLTGRHRLNVILGFAVDGVLTIGLIISVSLLVDALPAGKEAPQQLLLSAASALDHEHFGFRFVVLATGRRGAVPTG